MQTYVYLKDHYTGMIALDWILTNMNEGDKILEVTDNPSALNEYDEIESCTLEALARVERTLEHVNLVVFNDTMKWIVSNLESTTRKITLLNTKRFSGHQLDLIEVLNRSEYITKGLVDVKPNEDGLPTIRDGLNKGDTLAGKLKILKKMFEEQTHLILPVVVRNQFEFEIEELDNYPQPAHYEVYTNPVHHKHSHRDDRIYDSLESRVRTLGGSGGVIVHMYYPNLTKEELYDLDQLFATNILELIIRTIN